jgi:hypothetical protein
VVIGVSISLLFAPRPADPEPYPADDSAWSKWKRDPGGPYFDYDDGIGFRVVPILGLVASATNFVIIAPL